MKPKRDTSTDQAGAEYWEQHWDKAANAGRFDPGNSTLDNHMFQLVHAFLSQTFSSASLPDAPLLTEAGCGASMWLPYFAREFGFRVAGIDYTERGCEMARANLQAAGVSGKITQGDLFNLPTTEKGQAAVVFSTGLVEHFTPTAEILHPLAELAHPGGLVITMAPNMKGMPGLLQKLLDSDVYQTHVPLTPNDLAAAHEAVGLTVSDAGYLGTVNFGVVNIGRKSHKPWYPIATRLLAWAGKWYWLLERKGAPTVPNRFFSPTVYCVATKQDKG